ncbi:hypothetical protein D9M69_527500 [compost metagenome]
MASHYRTSVSIDHIDLINTEGQNLERMVFSCGSHISVRIAEVVAYMIRILSGSSCNILYDNFTVRCATGIVTRNIYS